MSGGAPTDPPAKQGSLTAPLTAPLFVQVLAIVLLSLLAAQGVNIGIVFLLPPPPPEYYTVTEVAAALKAQDRPFRSGNGRILTARAQARPAKDTPADWLAPREAALARNVAAELGAPADAVRITLFSRSRGLTHPAPALRPAAPFARPPRAEAGRYWPYEHYLVAPFEADVRLGPARWRTLKVTESGPLASWRQRIVLWFAISVLALVPVALLFARRLASPIAAFAEAAERLGRDPRSSPLTLRGPAEVLVAAEAFNQTQERLGRYVEDRTSMVGAIAHDLRTPLTRLRFRAEAAPEPLRSKMSATSIRWMR